MLLFARATREVKQRQQDWRRSTKERRENGMDKNDKYREKEERGRGNMEGSQIDKRRSKTHCSSCAVFSFGVLTSAFNKAVKQNQDGWVRVLKQEITRTPII